MTHPIPPLYDPLYPTPAMYDPLHPIGFQKFKSGYKGMCVSGRQFLKLWQVTDKIIEWIFMQFTFNILWVTLTQKIITDRVSKIHEWIWGDVYEWRKVS